MTRTRNRTKRFTAQHTIAFTPETSRQLEQVAHDNNMVISEVVRDLVEDGLARLAQNPEGL